MVRGRLCTALLTLAMGFGCATSEDDGGGIETNSDDLSLSYNGLAIINGLSVLNGLGTLNGLSVLNGLGTLNGLSSTTGLMTTIPGRMTVRYMVRCALAA